MERGTKRKASQALTAFNKPKDENITFKSKRKADGSPKKPSKRAAFGDITNRENEVNSQLSKKGGKIPRKQTAKKKKCEIEKTVPAKENEKDQLVPECNSEDTSWEFISQDSQKSLSQSTSNVSSSQSSFLTSSQSSTVLLSSQESPKDIEDEPETLSQVIRAPSAITSADSFKTVYTPDPLHISFSSPEAEPKAEAEPEPEWEDVDIGNLMDPMQAANYVVDIFNYYKEREAQFLPKPYFEKQPQITTHMRAIVVDWLVEIQENFELNHETLYLAIRLVDLYLTDNVVARDKLQLIAAVSLFIASKYDERVPPLLDDFLYICDDAYRREEMLSMERKILKHVNFDIGAPSSYRFLRRYAKCAKASLDTLTLARYVCETAQMDSHFAFTKDSILGASCLLLALKMKKTGTWNKTLEHYTGYKEGDLLELSKKLNHMIANPQFKELKTINSKYSHKVFFQVAKTPCLSDSDFEEEA